MSKTIKQFDIRLTRMKKADEMPFDPFIQVVLDHWMSSQHESAPIISAHLCSVGEIDEHFDNLIDDLNAVRVHAKSALKLARARTYALVKAK